MNTTTDPALPMIAAETVVRRILLIRAKKIMLDTNLAELYNVPTKALNQAVRRNIERFLADFMFHSRFAHFSSCKINNLNFPYPIFDDNPRLARKLSC